VISIRKLAAIDILFLGPKLILAELAIGVLGAAALGSFTLIRGHSKWQTVFRGYLLSLGVYYVPLFLNAVILARHRSSRQEVGDELADKVGAMRRYRRQTVLLLLPLVVPIAAVGTSIAWQLLASVLR
jgi:hypothetical protein